MGTGLERGHILSSADAIALRRPTHTGHRVKRFQAKPATDDRYVLAEGPYWDGERDRVLWVDIAAGQVHTGRLEASRVIPGAVLTFRETVGAVVSSQGGELLVAGARRLYAVSAGGHVSPGTEIIGPDVASRLNDGCCDPAGRFLVGSLPLDDRVGSEVLVRVEADGGILVIDDDLGLSNGLAFTPDGGALYSVDTSAETVWIREYDAQTGEVGRRRAFLQTEGTPDGLCVDELGNVWIAMWGSGEVRCYSAAGEQIAAVDVAAPNTTSVAFVGGALDTLLITTASEQLSEAQLAQYPDSGRLFMADVAVGGIPVPRWAGTPDSARTRRP
jgi:sugar lactone lactonase YvrE